MNSTIAANLYLFSKKNKDLVEVSLYLISILGTHDAVAVLKEYEKIKSGELKVCVIEYFNEPTAKQKKELELLIHKHIENQLAFVYQYNQEILGGYRIYIEDLLIDESVLSKI